MSNKIYVIIVTFNGKKWIEKCLISVLNSSVNVQIIIVDNNSTDDTLDIIKKKFKNIIIVENKINLGFGKANNIGISKALLDGGEYFFLINQDVYITNVTLQKLVEQMSSNLEYGILSPIHLNGKGSQIDMNFQMYIDSNNCKNFFSDVFLNKLNKSIYDVKFVNAAFWLISKETLKKVGGFNPYFFHYAEDNDYVNRCRFMKIKIGVVPECLIFHDRIQKVKDKTGKDFEKIEDLKLMDPNRKFTCQKMLKWTLKKIIKSIINLNRLDMINSIWYFKKTYLNRHLIKRIKKDIFSENYPFLDFKK